MTKHTDQAHKGEAPHHGRFELIVMAASVGGVIALQEILSQLPPDFPVPIAIVQHRTTKLPHMLAEVLGLKTKLSVALVEDGERITPGHVYVARPDRHLIVNPDHSVSSTDGVRIRHLLSSANPLFTSAAEVYGDKVIAVVLTGGDSDATDGVQSVSNAGGVVLAQDEATSVLFSMPRSAIATGAVDYVLPLQEIAPKLVELVMSSPAA